MNLLSEITFDFFIVGLAVTLIDGAARGVVYSMSKGGHSIRKPLIRVNSKWARVSMLVVGIGLLVWLIFRIAKLV